MRDGKRQRPARCTTSNTGKSRDADPCNVEAERMIVVDEQDLYQHTGTNDGMRPYDAHDARQWQYSPVDRTE